MSPPLRLDLFQNAGSVRVKLWKKTFDNIHEGIKNHTTTLDRLIAMGINFKDLIAAIKEEANPRKWDMTQLAKNFFEGLFILVPVVVTVYVMFFLFEAVDGWLNIPVPGLGFIITIGGVCIQYTNPHNHGILTIRNTIWKTTCIACRRSLGKRGTR